MNESPFQEIPVAADIEEECYACPRADDLRPCIFCGLYHCPDHHLPLNTLTEEERKRFNPDDVDADDAVVCRWCAGK